VGEHQKPTVIVQDWRLPPGWIKHMYQRSNVLGKWDVILVSPSGKRFRSKSDLKLFLESQDLVYNPDVSVRFQKATENPIELSFAERR